MLTESSVCCCSRPAANQAELEAVATNPSTKFSDFFETAKVGSDGKCPEGFSAANPPSAYYKTMVNGKSRHVQCLKIKVGAAHTCAA
jgi:hypothetical protein